MGVAEEIPDTVEEIDPKIAGVLAYSLGFISGMILYFIHDDTFVRFHALQSIIVFGGIIMLSVIINTGMFFFSFIPVFGSIIGGFLTLILWGIGAATLGLWLFLMLQAYSGKRFSLPLVGPLAESYC
jgi:uncharacterized membrane protein